MSEINVTPMVDVMLVLLIIFMVSAPLMTISIPVDLPETSAGSDAKADREQLTVSLKKTTGACTSLVDVYLGESPIKISELRAKLAAIKEHAKVADNVMVNADKDVCYADIMRMLGRLNAAGFGAALRGIPELERE
jgi:biopolymer transport protein ExbD/biopolymer transport protein TolR